MVCSRISGVAAILGSAAGTLTALAVGLVLRHAEETGRAVLPEEDGGAPR